MNSGNNIIMNKKEEEREEISNQSELKLAKIGKKCFVLYTVTVLQIMYHIIYCLVVVYNIIIQKNS